MAGRAPRRSAHRHIQLYMNTHRMVFGSSKFPAHVFMQPVGHHEESISHWQVWIGLGCRVYFHANMMHNFPGEQRIECWTLWWSHYAQCTWCHTCHQYTSVIMTTSRRSDSRGTCRRIISHANCSKTVVLNMVCGFFCQGPWRIQQEANLSCWVTEVLRCQAQLELTLKLCLSDRSTFGALSDRSTFWRA
jgi:hypothetical protein